MHFGLRTCLKVAGEPGLEPGYHPPKGCVLPLDDSPKIYFYPTIPHCCVSLQFGSKSFYPKFLKTDRKPRYARHKRNQTLGRAKRKGVGGNEFLPALAFPPPPNFVPVKLARH